MGPTRYEGDLIMSDKATAPELRLKFYIEGGWWVCSILFPDDNIELGRVRLAIVELEANREAFIKMMQDHLTDFMVNTLGKPQPEFLTRISPPHSRKDN
jgi:hypothetical protein